MTKHSTKSAAICTMDDEKYEEMTRKNCNMLNITKHFHVQNTRNI